MAYRLLRIVALVLVFAVFGCSNEGPGEINHRPEIVSLSSERNSVAVTGRVTLTCEAWDPDGDPLTYSWSATAGSVSGIGTTVEWVAPDRAGDYEVMLFVADNHAAYDRASLVLHARTNHPSRVLIDASGRGAWWYWCPQSPPYSESELHVGKALADFIRGSGFDVVELAPGGWDMDSLLDHYDNILRDDGIDNPGYPIPDGLFEAYDHFLGREGTALIFMTTVTQFTAHHVRFAERYGVLIGGYTYPYYASITRFASHQITSGSASFLFDTGSAFLDPAANPSLEVLAWLPDTVYNDFNENHVRDEDEPYGPAVMGVLHHPTAKVFIICSDISLFQVPRPFTTNLIEWAFR